MNNETLVQVSQGRYDDWHVVAMIRVPAGELIELNQKLKENREALDKAFLELGKFQQITRLEPCHQSELDAWKINWDRLHDEAAALRKRVLSYPAVTYENLQLD